MLLDLPNRPTSEYSGPSSLNFKAGQNSLKRLIHIVGENESGLKAQNFQILSASDNLEGGEIESSKPSFLQFYLLDEKNPTPFYAAYNPAIRFELNNRDGKLTITSKTATNVSHINEEKVADFLNLPESEMEKMVVSKLSTFLTESIKNAPVVQDGPN